MAESQNFGSLEDGLREMVKQAKGIGADKSPAPKPLPTTKENIGGIKISKSDYNKGP